MPSTEKSAIEILGLEYDWIGRDDDGHVALFSTAGTGYAPKAFLRDTDAHYDAIQTLLALPASTATAFFPVVGAGCINTWQLVAERGLYVYDSNPSGGPYDQVAAPLVPVRIESLPKIFANIAAPLGHSLRFQTLETIDDEMLHANDG